YLKMIDDARAAHGIIGMIQPKTDMEENAPPLYATGGAGRITNFVETEDGRYLIRLTGISRFQVCEELAVTTPYRQVKANWAPFSADTLPLSEASDFDRAALMVALQSYLEARGLAADYDGIKAAPDTVLINTLSMIIPLTTGEKQALLEAETTACRAETLKTLLTMVTTGQHLN
ncbi:MAG: LON peptidase substrate-binding domain-containing protein, partial [Kordiimonadaceae bacterium]|nr:LON peptidase substrate-binding domain-containing protein [Kordiimonadaceae bacterium]